MTKILSSKQLQQADKITVKNQKTQSIDLMEFASKQCFEWIHNRLQGNPLKIHVFCGTGNNGGDGLAIARMLKKYGYHCVTYVIHSDKRSADFLTNYKRLQELGSWPEMIENGHQFPVISENDMVIDAIFGIGLNRSPKGIYKQIIQHINQSNAYVLAIDIPSGLFLDKTVQDRESVIKAFQILTFQTSKLAFLLPENEVFCANWDVLPIGLDEEFIFNQPTDYFITLRQDILPLYKMRSKFSHKRTYGHALLIGGSFGKIGAVSLASKATLRIGAGLVSVYIPKCGYLVLQTAVPEVMVEVDTENEIRSFNYRASLKTLYFILL